MERGVEYSHLRDIRKKFHGSFNPGDIGVIMKWCKLPELSDCIQNLTIDQHGLMKYFPTMGYTVTDSCNLPRLITDDMPGIG